MPSNCSEMLVFGTNWKTFPSANTPSLKSLSTKNEAKACRHLLDHSSQERDTEELGLKLRSNEELNEVSSIARSLIDSVVWSCGHVRRSTL